MRIAFMGTPDFAVPTLDALASAGHELVMIYTQPPRRAGRGKAVQPSPVQRRATALGLPVRTPVSLRDPDEHAAFSDLDLDAAIVAAYGLILPMAILQAPRMGCLNVHGSLLPRWRGAAPVQRAILAGDDETGIAIMQMERGLDTGPVRLETRVRIERKTSGDLTAELANLGAKLVVQVLTGPGTYPPRSQLDHGVTYAAKIEKIEAKLDFSASAIQLDRQIRAFNPSPGAFFEYQEERIQILAVDIEDGQTLQNAQPGTVLDSNLRIACGVGAIRPLLVKRAGRAAMPVVEFLRGFAVPEGTRLS